MLGRGHLNFSSLPLPLYGAGHLVTATFVQPK